MLDGPERVRSPGVWKARVWVRGVEIGAGGWSSEADAQVWQTGLFG